MLCWCEPAPEREHTLRHARLHHIHRTTHSCTTHAAPWRLHNAWMYHAQRTTYTAPHRAAPRMAVSRRLHHARLYHAQAAHTVHHARLYHAHCTTHGCTTHIAPRTLGHAPWVTHGCAVNTAPHAVLHASVYHAFCTMRPAPHMAASTVPSVPGKGTGSLPQSSRTSGAGVGGEVLLAGGMLVLVSREGMSPGGVVNAAVGPRTAGVGS